MTEPSLVLLNATTFSSTRGLRLRSKFRDKVLFFQLNGALVRLLPERPLVVTVSWVEENRPRLVELQKAGAIQFQTTERVAFHLEPSGPIELPEPLVRVPVELPVPEGERPAELRGEALFTGTLDPGERAPLTGWVKVPPTERDAEYAPPRATDTPDTAFPSPSPSETASTEKPAAPEEDLLGDLLAESPSLPSFVEDLPADMLDGAPEDEKAGEPLYVERAPTPPAQERRGRRRRG